MTEPMDLPGMAEAARLLDDQTQQLTPVPVWLTDADETESPRNAPDPAE